jgi:hypothetical protein
MVHDVLLNERQRDTLSWYFNNTNDDGEPIPYDEPITFDVVDGQLVVNGNYLNSDGEWGGEPR